MNGVLIYTAVVVPATVVAPLYMGGRSYARLRLPHRVILFYLVFGGVMDVVAGYTSAHKMNNLWLLHFYTAVEAVILLWFYRLVIREGWARKVITALMVFFPLLCAANFHWWQSLRKANTYTRPLEALILISAGLLYFLENSQSAVNTSKGPRIALSWINGGLLLYFSLSFFIFIFSNYLYSGQSFSGFIEVLGATFELIMYLLITVGFYKCSL